MIDFDNRVKMGRALRMSTWIRNHKELLVAAGAAGTASAKVIAWIVTHVEDIRVFVDAVHGTLKAPALGEVLDFDALRIGNESLPVSLRSDPRLVSRVVREILRQHDFQSAETRSVKSRNLLGE